MAVAGLPGSVLYHGPVREIQHENLCLQSEFCTPWALAETSRSSSALRMPVAQNKGPRGGRGGLQEIFSQQWVDRRIAPKWEPQRGEY